jgi:ABC-type sugar transport system substrate-binding protein
MYSLGKVMAAVVIGIAILGCQPEQQAASAVTPARGVERESESAGDPGSREISIGVMPKLVGIPYFNATERGAIEAAQELGVTLIYDGPKENDVQAQAELLETWVAKGYDAIAVAPNDPDAIAPVLQKARRRGIKVFSWDADAREEARDYFINQCTSESVAKYLMDVMAEGAGPDAKYIIITGSLTAANQNIWMEEMEKYRQSAYPSMANLSRTPKVSEEDQALATQVAADSLRAYAELGGIFAITSVSLPGSAEALRKAGAADRVFLTGLATPNDMKPFIADGTVKKFVLWDAVDLGYLAVHVAAAVVRGELMPGATGFKAGRLGEVKIENDEVILGPPIVFSKDNIDQYDF